MNIILRPVKDRDYKPIAVIMKKLCREFTAAWPGSVYTDPATDDV